MRANVDWFDLRGSVVGQAMESLIANIESVGTDGIDVQIHCNAQLREFILAN